MTNNKQQQQQGQPLLTPAAVALSLAPPRCPPHGSILRKLYTHPKAAHKHFAQSDPHELLPQIGHHDDHDEDNDHYQSHTLTSRLVQLRPKPNFHIHHPHIPTSFSIPDTLTRFLGAVLPLETQHSGRDDGHFRAIVDGLVAVSAPSMAVGHWEEAKEFLELSTADAPRLPLPSLLSAENESENVGDSNGNRSDNDDDAGDENKRKGRRGRWTRKRVPYGDHLPMQYFDLFLPSATTNNDKTTTQQKQQHQNKIPIRGTIFFVHGGAWGSGQPWMYRLIAPTFLKLNFAVVIAGYRTYPEAQTMEDQSGDVKMAWERCESVLNEYVVPIQGGKGNKNNSDGGSVDDDDNNNGWVGNVIMGHSSGAHVAMLLLVDMMEERMKTPDGSSTNNNNTTNQSYYPWNPDYFIGLSGPYDISYHFDYEAGRGVEQISPMKPICGHSRENFDRASPVKRLFSLLGQHQREAKSPIQQLAPPILLVHGIEDSTVPFTATSDAARGLRSCGITQCDEIYMEETGHQDVVMHFMMGGVAKDLVLDWLWKCSRQKEMGRQLQSRL